MTRGTWRTLALVALWLFVFITALSGGWSVMFKLSYLLLLLFGAAWAWTRFSGRYLEVERVPVTARAQVGSVLEERLIVRNQSWIPQPALDIHAESTLPDHGLQTFGSVGPNDEVECTLRSVCAQRGRYELGPTTITVGDPFGLFQRAQVYPARSAVIVYPQTVDLPGFQPLDGDLAGGGRRRERVPYTTAMATGIREYNPGDPFNRIHWPNTARLGRLLVKEFEQDPVSDVWIVLDLDRNVQVGRGTESTEEHGVTIAASLAKHALFQGRAVGLLTQGHVLEPDRGTRQLMKLLELLAVVQARDWQNVGDVLVGSGARFARGTTALVITPTVRQDWLSAYEDVAQRGVRTSVVLLEASTFGGAAPSLMLVSALAAANVPTYLVKHGEPLDQALAQASASASSAGWA